MMSDGGPLSIFESGAILTYLAEKSGRFLAPSGPERFRAMEWLHWQIGSLGPMLGQLGYFAKRAEEKTPAAIARFTEEGERLLGVVERQLAQSPYLAGNAYSIADIAAYPWMLAATTFLKEPLAEALADKPAMERWLQEVGERPAVKKGMQVPQVYVPTCHHGGRYDFGEHRQVSEKFTHFSVQASCKSNMHVQRNRIISLDQSIYSGKSFESPSQSLSAEQKTRNLKISHYLINTFT